MWSEDNETLVEQLELEKLLMIALLAQKAITFKLSLSHHVDQTAQSILMQMTVTIRVISVIVVDQIEMVLC